MQIGYKDMKSRIIAIIPAERLYDIDDETDLKIVEAILREKK